MENEKLTGILSRFLKEQPVSAVLSGQFYKNEFIKMRLHPILSGGKLRFQAEEFRGKQAFHKNLGADEAVS